MAAGNAPLQAGVDKLQGILDAPKDTVKVKEQAVPTVDQRSESTPSARCLNRAAW